MAVTSTGIETHETGNAPNNSDISALNRRIDDIVAFQKQRRPWYADTGVLISAAAFFISVMTTAVSWYRSYQQDVVALRTELRTAIQAANMLQLQNIESFSKYGADNPTFLAVSSTLNAQNFAIAQQAYSVVTALGASASAIDLTSTANALVNSGQLLLAEILLKQATARAQNSLDDVAAWRVLAGTQYGLGKRELAQESIKKAFDVFDRYPSETSSKDYVNQTHAYTYLFWAGIVQANDCAQAQQSLTQANTYLSSLPATFPQTIAMRSEAARLSTAVMTCQESPSVSR